MSIPKEASVLVTWTRGKFTLAQAVASVEAYKAGTLGDGLIKDFLTERFPLVLKKCLLPGCNNLTSNLYCDDCLSMSKDSVAVNLFKAIGDFLVCRAQ